MLVWDRQFDVNIQGRQLISYIRKRRRPRSGNT